MPVEEIVFEPLDQDFYHGVAGFREEGGYRQKSFTTQLSVKRLRKLGQLELFFKPLKEKLGK